VRDEQLSGGCADTAGRPAAARPPQPDGADRARLAALVAERAVVHGRVVLASGREADYYIDGRLPLLQHDAARLIGTLMRQLTADWDYAAVGGLTLGADPVALAMMHAPGRPIDAFVVRKQVKTHGMAKRIEGPDVNGRKVLAVEDTSTSGGSVLTAVAALREAGAQVVGVATVIDRATGAAEAIREQGLAYRYLLDLNDLGLE
jgi:orotate phosphoribosyltransferase